MRRIILNEMMSISDDVVKLTNIIRNAIINDIKTKGDEIGVLNKDGALPSYRDTIDVSYIIDDGRNGMSQFSLLSDIDNIKVTFHLYIVENEYAAKLFYNQNYHKLNCEADFDNKTMIIKSIWIEDRQQPFDTDFMNSVQHEVEHLYQYSKGMTKNVNLYDLVVKGVASNDINVIKYARALYYTFPHEQDAFVNGLYGKITSNYTKEQIKQLTFDDLCDFCEYSAFENTLDITDDIQLSDIEKDKLLYSHFGITLRKFNIRVNKALKRFQDKISNVERRLKASVVDEIWLKQPLSELIFEYKLKRNFKYFFDSDY